MSGERRNTPCPHGCAGCDSMLAAVLARANRLETALRQIANEATHDWVVLRAREAIDEPLEMIELPTPVKVPARTLRDVVEATARELGTGK